MRGSVRERHDRQAVAVDTKDKGHPIRRLFPQKMRVVALVLSETGRVVQRDCYDPRGNEVDMSGIMRVEDGKLWLHTVDWARSSAREADVCRSWECAGVTAGEIGRISVFTWPDGEPLRVFIDSI